MTRAETLVIALEHVVRATGHKFPQFSQLQPKTRLRDSPWSFPVSVGGYGIALLDLTIDDQGRIRLIEANGSNGNMTSIAFGSDDRRATHMYHCALPKMKETPKGVIVCGLSGSRMHIAEYFSRILHFVDQLQSDTDVVIRHADEPLGGESITVIVDTVPSISQHTTRTNSRLSFRNRPIIFACNANILLELVRAGRISRQGHWYDVDISIFQDAAFVPFVLDKGLQQDAANGTGIAPLVHYAAWNFEEAVTKLESFHREGRVAVCKIHGGSAAVGVCFIPPSGGRAARAALEELLKGAAMAYGGNAGKTIYPIGIFEFARAKPYILEDGPHLWDMRVECLVYPDHIEVTPCVIRICPAPFDGHSYSRNAVVSNLTGRPPSLTFVRSAMSIDALKKLDLDVISLHRVADVCSQWCQSAWKRSATI